jgi:hypothetical protein
MHTSEINDDLCGLFVIAERGSNSIPLISVFTALLVLFLFIFPENNKYN